MADLHGGRDAYLKSKLVLADACSCSETYKPIPIKKAETRDFWDRLAADPNKWCVNCFLVECGDAG